MTAPARLAQWTATQRQRQRRQQASRRKPENSGNPAPPASRCHISCGAEHSAVRIVFLMSYIARCYFAWAQVAVQQA